MSSLVEMLKRHEGLRLKPYRDTVGILTIGYGRNLEGKGITEEEALTLLSNDIAEARRALELALPTWKILTENRRNALIDMVFNLGMGRFKGFYRLLKALSEERWEDASKEMLDSKWAEQVGPRAFELAKLMREG